jgi:23S rRNA pseudouridine1911/1915/1917 synthase
VDLKKLFPITIADLEKATRVDQFLSERFPEVSRSRWKALLDENVFAVDQKPIKSSSKIKNEQIISINESKVELLAASPSIWEKKQIFKGLDPGILFEDPYLIVLNKPTGLAVHPGAGISAQETLVAWLMESGKLEKVGPEERVQWGESVLEDERPGIVHRLDRGTSGAMVVAKTPEVHRTLAAEFESRSAGRIYWAVVKGDLKTMMEDRNSVFRKKMREASAHLALQWNPEKNLGTFVSFLNRDPVKRTSFRVDPAGGGRKALTQFYLLNNFQNYSLIALKLGTGRTHQIRVHLSFFGLPIVGDRLYGGEALDSVGSQFEDARFLLHARCLHLIHPKTGAEMAFDAPEPSHFTNFLHDRDFGKEPWLMLMKKKWSDWNSIFPKAGLAD